jgi:hypothetical protein
MAIDLRVREADWNCLCDLFKVSFRTGHCPETGALGILGECRGSRKNELLLAKVFPPEPGDIKIASHDHLVFSSSYLRRAHLEMRREHLAGLVLFHTHPLANASVSFSWYDDCEEPLLVENLQELEPATRLVSVVVGKNVQCGRLWLNRADCRQMGRLIVVGERLLYCPLNGLPAPPSAPPEAIFDRAQRVTGAGALALLSGLTVVVVGASGTGSIICELLARAGCKHIILIDYDVIKDINLNRILYATQFDADRKALKVEVIRRGIDVLGLGCRVETLVGNILDREILARLRDADILIGCIDKAYPRQLLCEFAYRFQRPYIDVGAEIGGDEKGIVSVDARTSYIAPGRPCLQCAGVVTARQLSFESLSAGERRRVRKQGYSDDLVMDQPAVMDLNMRAASGGMIVLRHLLQPFLLSPLPVVLLENLVTYSMRPISEARALSSGCAICQANRRAGYGDCGPALGLDAATVAAIMGIDPPQTPQIMVSNPQGA